jgi:hypothetical protein
MSEKFESETQLREREIESKSEKLRREGESGVMISSFQAG